MLSWRTTARAGHRRFAIPINRRSLGTGFIANPALEHHGPTTISGRDPPDIAQREQITGHPSSTTASATDPD